jgi:hypothetical protein
VLGPDAGNIPPAGVLRIQRGASTFDPDFFIDLNAITGSPGIVAPFFVDGSTLALQFWDPDVDISGRLTVPDDFFDAEEFVYGLLDLSSRSFSRLTSIPKGGAYSNAEYRFDDALYAQLFSRPTENVIDADVYRVTSTGAQKAFTIFGGTLENLERLR